VLAISSAMMVSVLSSASTSHGGCLKISQYPLAMFGTASVSLQCIGERQRSGFKGPGLGGFGIARASELHLRSLAPGRLLRALFGRVGRLPAPIFDHGTKTEHLATILLPDPVAARDTKRDVVDGDAEIFKENKPQQNGPLRAEMAATEFRVRFISIRRL
jgi:hypothetical protein